MQSRQQQIIRASWISIGGNASLSAIKIAAGLIAGSLAVVGDGLDSASDIVTSVITLVTAHIVSRPPNARFPYGYEKADTIAAKVLAFIIFFAGAQLAISTSSRLIEGLERPMPGTLALWVTGVSIIGKILLARYQRRVGKKIESAMLIANARNMQNDVIISLSVLLGLLLTFVLKLPLIDTITALAISLWIMYSGYKIFMESNLELMDGVQDQSIYKKIFSSVAKVPGAYNPHNCRVRKMGHLYLIALDLEVDGSLSVTKAHELSHHVDNQLRADIPNIYDILIHIEPYGSGGDKRYGVSNREVE